ncbi:metallophosphoesterase [Fulvivirga lutea]|uniref:Metallophosphoesterase n=1 Tax=Fulvivirga lutea TaxID=2810512 RepID=A0A974WII6_9BACT|nr:metallophosphoesterase [Fulvivirga lutea]QSE99194.1 metallophosphoesterase [Fulvivirga lutea]
MLMIQFASDLHLEFPINREYLREYPLVPVADTLILAGDLLVLNDDGSVDDVYEPFLDRLSQDFEQVYAIPGNHEYYNGFDLNNSIGEFQLKLRDNITLLNNSSVVIDNHKVIFSTLWSYVPSSFRKNEFADFMRCKFKGEMLTTEGYNELHKRAKAYISVEIEDNPRQHEVIVITHHLPSFSLIDKQYLGSDLNAGFASMSDGLIHESKAIAWVYGHSHSNSLPKQIGDTMLYSNPLGYVHVENPKGFDRSRLIWNY